MTDTLRFNAIEARAEMEAKRNLRLAEAAQRIGRNVQETRKHNISPARLNTFLNNERRGLARDFNGSVGRSYEILDHLAEMGDPLAKGILDSIRTYRDAEEEKLRQRGDLYYLAGSSLEGFAIQSMGVSSKIEYSLTGHPFGTDIIPKLYNRTMTEAEYEDYLNGNRPFAVFGIRDPIFNAPVGQPSYAPEREIELFVEQSERSELAA